MVSTSFHHDDSMTVTAPNGGLVHRASLEHSDRFERKLWPVREGVWCMVGNGLSNQTFVEGPDGLIVIDTGECVEEMRAALDAVREFTDAPVVAVFYTHFHYVGGTTALTDEQPQLPIWGHAGIVDNRRRASTEVGPVSRAGLIHQFGMTLPDNGPDALVNVGLGLAFRNPQHAPFTEGFVAPTDTFDSVTTTSVAGLQVEFRPAPSDSDDSVTIWFPELALCVNNIVWPVLFNIFAIRGEEYRDPQILLTGLDHIRSLPVDHLVGAHGPPLSGSEVVSVQVTRSRDAVQFLWDQTVRGVNKGLTLGELTEFVALPDLYAESSLQTQYYGVVEHHVRQIHAGLRGWFDGDEAALFPERPTERARKLIAGFGGAAEVRSQLAAAVDADDVRWAIELASWLVRADDAEPGDRVSLADLLRTIARRTTAANIRNWCLTRARHLDGTQSTDRFRAHRFSRQFVLDAPVGDTIASLRVMLDPLRCDGVDVHVRVDLPTESSGLHVRRGVAAPTDGVGATIAVSMDKGTWADVLTGARSLAEALADGTASSDTAGEVSAIFSSFEHPSFEV